MKAETFDIYLKMSHMGHRSMELFRKAMYRKLEQFWFSSHLCRFKSSRHYATMKG